MASTILLIVYFDAIFGFDQWWKWLLVLPVGLAPGMILGLLVQLCWDISINVLRKRFRWTDAAFAIFLLLTCLIPIGAQAPR